MCHHIEQLKVAARHPSEKYQFYPFFCQCIHGGSPQRSTLAGLCNISCTSCTSPSPAVNTTADPVRVHPEACCDTSVAAPTKTERIDSIHQPARRENVITAMQKRIASKGWNMLESYLPLGMPWEDSHSRMVHLHSFHVPKKLARKKNLKILAWTSISLVLLHIQDGKCPLPSAFQYII